MDNVVAGTAFFKIVMLVVMFVSGGWAVIAEENHRRKIIELFVFFAILTLIMTMQFVVPKMAGPNSQKLRDACTAWDPTPLFTN